MGDEKPGHFGSGGALEVPGEAPASAKPCKGTFNHPASGQELEAFDPERALDDLDGPRAAMGERVDQLLAAINPVGKDMPKLGKAISQAFQQRNGTMDILDVGGMNVNGQQQTIGISDDVPLAPMDALAGIKAACASGLGRRSTLAVDDGGSRLGLAPEQACRLLLAHPVLSPVMLTVVAWWSRRSRIAVARIWSLKTSPSPRSSCCWSR